MTDFIVGKKHRRPVAARITLAAQQERVVFDAEDDRRPIDVESVEVPVGGVKDLAAAEAELIELMRKGDAAKSANREALCSGPRDASPRCRHHVYRRAA